MGDNDPKLACTHGQLAPIHRNVCQLSKVVCIISTSYSDLVAVYQLERIRSPLQSSGGLDSLQGNVVYFRCTPYCTDILQPP